jgi:hypothetical protein
MFCFISAERSKIILTFLLSKFWFLTLFNWFNPEKTKYILMSLCQNKRQNHNVKKANIFFENTAQFKYFGTAVTNQNCIQEQITRRLVSCYRLAQKLLPSHLLYKNVKIRM